MRKLVLAVLVLGAVLSWLFATRAERSAAAHTPADVPRPAVERAVELAGATSPAPAVPIAGARESVPEESVHDSPARASVSAGESASFEFHGFARDALSGLPIAGARASTRSSRDITDSGRARKPDGCTATSDTQGRFALRLGPGQELGYGEVCASGYGPAAFVFDDAHERAERAVVVDLLPEAALEVHVADEAGLPLAAVEVALATLPESVSRGGRSVFTLTPVGCSATTDAAGIARLDGVSAETSFGWTVRAPAHSAWREGLLALAPGERRSMDVVLGGRARVAGTARDERGQALADLRLFLDPQGNRFHHGQSQRMLRTTSDASGAFEFLDVPFDTYELGAEAGELVERREVVVVDSGSVEHDLALVHGLFLSGRIVGDHIHVEGSCVVRVATLAGAPVLEHGIESAAFRVGPVPPGEYLVSASDFATTTEVVRASAGSEGLELRAEAPREVRVSVRGAEGPLEVSVLDLARPLRLQWTEDTPFFTAALPAGVYALRVTDEEDRIGLVARFVVAEEAPLDLTVDAQRGACCTLVHRATDRARSMRLWVADQVFPLEHFQGGAEVPPGAALSALVPAGPVSAELVEEGRVVAREEVVLVPGERHRFVLEPR